MTTKPPETLCRFGRAAGLGALAAAVLLVALRGALLDTGLGNLAEFLVGLLLGAVVAAVAWLLVRLLLRGAGRLPASLLHGLAAAALTAWFFDSRSVAALLRTLLDPDAWEWPLALPTGLDLVSAIVMIAAVGLLAGTATVVSRGEWRLLDRGLRLSMAGATGVLTVAALFLAAGLIQSGHDPYPTDFSLAAAAASSSPDPTAPGPFEVTTLSYGAGENVRRPEFGTGRDLTSRTVDASLVLPEWKGLTARMRERYWGFGLEAAPLNGTIYAPSVAGSGAGPWPLALIVHGNHGMEDYSDGGYAYLGELLASRGVIAVSVDQNYLNGTWSGDFRGKEMAARAWLLLEHLALWRDWNAEAGHRFESRVDMERIALVGHSRGGEAVSIAHAFNALPHFPDDATVNFDYGFGIDALVAIAQVDQRYHRRVQLTDVSFLALHGSYDSDEPAYHGLRQFNRITLTGDEFRFKAGIYIHGANHGQFNSTWGRYDYGPPEAWLLNTAPIIPAEDQRKVAAGYIAAFAEATLNGDDRYLPLFRDPGGAAWLPEHAYVSQYRDSRFHPIATFDEDLDVTTGSARGSTIETASLAVWREEALLHRDGRPQGTNAVVIGGNEGASFGIRLPGGFWDGFGETDLLALSVAKSTETLPDADDTDDDDDRDNKDDSPPVFDIEAVHRDGSTVRLASTSVAALPPPLHVQYLKNETRNDAEYNDTWEPVLQYMELPLSALAGNAPVGDIAIIRLVAGPSTGVLIVDDIGIRRAGGMTSEHEQ